MRRLALPILLLFIVACSDGVVQPDTPGARAGSDLAPALSLNGGDEAEVEFWLTLLHNNDGESRLLPETRAGFGEVGGVARFASLVELLRREARGGFASVGRGSPGAGRGKGKGMKGLGDLNRGDGVLLVSAGDNFLAGPQLNASLSKGVPFFDGLALDLIGYDALAIGNHEFDFGPDVLADFIVSFPKTEPPFLSANLDFSAEPGLALLEGQGRIAPSVVVRERGQRIGIVGATTELLQAISSPRNVIVQDVATAVQAEIDALEADGVQVILLISHLQSVEEDRMLIPMLTGVDVAVAGGGDEILASADDVGRLLPGDEAMIEGDYPLLVMGGDGQMVPLVTAAGNYRYVGRLIVGFDADGKAVAVDEGLSGPFRVAAADGLEPDPVVQAEVTDPVAAALEALAVNVLAIQEVDLDARRSSVRGGESNAGNLVADALLQQATELASAFGQPMPDVALQNGGGIRSDKIFPAGEFTELESFELLPFPNFVVIVPDIPRAQFKEILENAVSRVEFGDGRFAQVSGFEFEWDPAGTPQEVDDDGNVLTTGTRVRHVELDDGTAIVSGGAVVDGPDLAIATIDFLATGGDQYPFRGADFTRLGVTYQQALQNFVTGPLAGLISAADYPEGGEGRITELP